MHRMALDEFVETVDNKDFNFGTFVVFARGYTHLLLRQREPARAHIRALFDEIARIAETKCTPAAALSCSIARTILLPAEAGPSGGPT
jgi:hypothetical protein